MGTQLIWWGYAHINGSLQAKRYLDGRDMEDAEYSPFVEKVYGPFPADTREEAIEYLKFITSTLKKVRQWH